MARAVRRARAAAAPSVDPIGTGPARPTTHRVPRRRLRPAQAARYRRGDGGMVTAETAILLPALAVVLAGLLWVLAAVVGQVRCLDAAREAARLAGRGDSTAAASSVARRLAPPGATVSIARHGGQVVATVRARQAPFGGWAARLGSMSLRASATATDEAATAGGIGGTP